MVIVVEPEVPHYCQLVTDREVSFPKKKGLCLSQHRTNMYSVVIAVEPEAPRFCQLVADREVGFPKKRGL